MDADAPMWPMRRWCRGRHQTGNEAAIETTTAGLRCDGWGLLYISARSWGTPGMDQGGWLFLEYHPPPRCLLPNVENEPVSPALFPADRRLPTYIPSPTAKNCGGKLVYSTVLLLCTVRDDVTSGNPAFHNRRDKVGFRLLVSPVRACMARGIQHCIFVVACALQVGSRGLYFNNDEDNKHAPARTKAPPRFRWAGIFSVARPFSFIYLPHFGGAPFPFPHSRCPIYACAYAPSMTDGDKFVK